VATRPKDLRLRREADIKVLFRSGRTVSEPPFKVYFRATDRPHPRYGVQVSRRNAKLAVTRNRIRRRAREAFRGPLAASARGVDLMVLAGPEAATLPWDELVARCLRLVERLLARLDQPAEERRAGSAGQRSGGGSR
jgi:ribonuclease P protein component